MPGPERRFVERFIPPLTEADQVFPGLDGVAPETSAAESDEEFTPSDPFFDDQEHHLNPNPGQYDLNIVDVWDNYTGAGVVITVIDGGIRATHDDLDDNYDAVTDYDYANDDFVVQTNSHGTAISGIIASEQGNGLGGVGVAYDATIRMFQGTSFTAGFRDDQILDAAGLGDGVGNANGNLASAAGDVVNMSNGRGSNVFAPVADAVNALRTASAQGRDGLGQIHVKSSGNSRGAADSPDREETTAEEMDSSRYTIVVGATRTDGWVVWDSSPGASVHLAAITDNLANNSTILTTSIASDVSFTGSSGGTSSAAPQVSGVVALMLEANPDLGWRDVQEILALSARHVGSAIGTAANTGAPFDGDFEQETLGATGTWQFNGASTQLTWNGGGLHHSNDYGFGLVDAKAAVRLAETWDLQQTSANDVFEFRDNLTPVHDDTPSAAGNEWTTTVNSGDNLIVEHVALELSADIDRLGDIEIVLTSPSGTAIQLLADTGDTASRVLTNWDFGTPGFWGEQALGTWTVEIADQNGVGTQVTDIDLEFWGKPITQDDLFVITEEFAAYAGQPGHSQALFGGSGTNTLNAAAVDVATTLDLQLGTGTIAGVGVLNANIQRVFTGDGNDTITGDTSSEMIDSGRGEDLVYGGDASETIFGRRGDDSLFGGAGSDIIYGNGGDDYLEDNQDSGLLYGGAGHDTFYARTGVQFMYGGSGADSFTYRTGLNTTVFINDDLLNGGSGHDRILLTTEGGFSFNHTNPAGTILNSVEELEFEYGVGEFKRAIFSTVVFEASGQLPSGFQIDFNGGGEDELILNLDSTRGAADFDASDWVFQDWNAADEIRFNGDAGENSISGTSVDDLIYGGSGNDTLFGNAGNDTFFDDELGSPNGQVDSYYGGAGVDTLIASAPWSGAALFSLVTGELILSTLFVRDRFTGIENLHVGGNADIIGNGVSNHFVGLDADGANQINAFGGNDTIEAGGGADVVYGGNGDDIVDAGAGADFGYGGSGNDTLDGAAGNDTLEGGPDDDLFVGGDGADSMDGDAGSDWVSYATSVMGVEVNLGTGQGDGGDAEGDRLQNIPNVIGSDHADFLTGDAAANTLDGGEGNDILRGAEGPDHLVGGGGFDFADYRDFTSVSGGPPNVFVINLQKPAASSIEFAEDTLVDIKGLFGSALLANVFIGHDDRTFYTGGRTGDDINGNGGSDILRGLSGNDVINGGDGKDAILGNSGNDTLTGGADRDIFWFGLGVDDDDVITDFTLDQDLIGFQGDLVDSVSDLSITSQIGTGSAILSWATGSLVLDGVTDVEAAASANYLFV